MSAPDWNLARRAVACPRWRWMPGMLLDAHERLVGIDPEGIPYGHSHTAGHRVWLHERSLPNLSDPATMGCLLALVREAFGDPTLFAECHPVGAKWQTHSVDGGIFGEGDTEAAALVAALEAAP